MLTRSSRRWLATIGLVAAAGIGTTVGLVNGAGATGGTTGSVSRTVDGPVTTASFTFSASVSGLTPRPSPSPAAARPISRLTPCRSRSPCRPCCRQAHSWWLGRSRGHPRRPVGSHGLPGGPEPGLHDRGTLDLGGVAIQGVVHHSCPVHKGRIRARGRECHRAVRGRPSRHGDFVGERQGRRRRASGSKIVATRSTRALTANVWADSSGRLVQATVGVTGTARRGPLGLTATVDFAGYGSPVTVTVPPPSQVKAIPYSIVKMFLGGAHHVVG